MTNQQPGERTRSWRPIVLWALLALAALVLAYILLVNTMRHREDIKADTITQTSITKYVGIDDFKAACEQLNRRLTPANIIYDPEMEMVRGDAKLVEAAVTLDVGTLPEQILDVEGPAVRQVLVSCKVEAELRSDSNEFEIKEPGWQPQQLTTQRTAHWNWFVTPKLRGTHEIVLAVRPVVVIVETNIGAESKESDATEVPHPISVVVSIPWYERLPEILERTKNVLASAKETLLALGGVVSAILIILGLVRRSRRRSADSKPAPPGA